MREVGNPIPLLVQSNGQSGITDSVSKDSPVTKNYQVDQMTSSGTVVVTTSNTFTVNWVAAPP
jgi:hypothetical protein